MTIGLNCGNNHSMRRLSKLTLAGSLLVIVASAGVGYSFLNLTSGPQTTPANLPSTSIAAAAVPPKRLSASKVEALVNQIRVKHNLPKLTTSRLLRKSACARLNDMVERSYWSHYSPNGTGPWYFFTKTGYYYTSAAENLAYGQDSETSVVREWASSPTHYKNMVGHFSQQGVCTKTETYLGVKQSITVQHLANPA